MRHLIEFRIAYVNLSDPTSSVWVNPNHVSSVEVKRSNLTAIRMSNGDEYRVELPTEQVITIFSKVVKA